MPILILLILLPLGVIGVQNALDLDNTLGIVGYSLYKFFFLIPPLIYCYTNRISVWSDILKPHNWRQSSGIAAALGVLAILIFWGAYLTLGDLLLDKDMIVSKIGDQFKVNRTTIFLIAPLTIFANSLLEEFFYRGFAFGLLAPKHRTIGFLLPAFAFTVQHMLFIYHWVTPLPAAMAVAGLFIFALVLQVLYERADSIIAPWVTHIFGDVAMMSIAVSMLYF